MKIGLFGARLNNRGLGIQTWEFYRHMKPSCTAVVIDDGDDLSLSDRFSENATWCDFPPDDKFIDKWLDEQKPDVIYCAESPYNYYLFKAARDRGVKTVLQYNYEFLDYLQHPDWPFPDVLMAPSKWHIREVEVAFSGITKVIYLPFPVNREVLPMKQKKNARRFIHVCGNIELYEDRNGTKTVIDSLPFIKEKISLTCFVGNKDLGKKLFGDVLRCPENVELEIRALTIENYWDLYKDADVFLSPRRFAGQSLPLNESLSTGMIPIMPNVGPQNQFLHPMSLTPVCGKKWIMTRSLIDAYDINPQTLASHIDIIAGLNKKQVSELSQYSDLLATQISWENLKPKYLRLFEELINEKS